MHFPYIVYCQYAPYVRFTLLPAAESINVRHARNILRTASIARESVAWTRTKETRKIEGRDRMKGKTRGIQRERALSFAWFESKFTFLRDREVCVSTNVYEGTFNKPCQRQGKRDRQKSDFMALEIRFIEREVEVKTEKERQRGRKEEKRRYRGKEATTKSDIA